MARIKTGRAITSINPATGQPLAEVYAASPQAVEAKVARARTTLESWRATSLPVRVQAIRSLTSALARESMRTAQALSAETGRPVQESLGAEVLPTIRSLEFICRQARPILQPARMPAQRIAAFAEPYGVIGIIGTWNYPLFLNLVSICQALVAGNTVVWKPSELAIYCAQETQRLLEAADLPADVVQIALGDAETGRALTRADCDKYIFTGGVGTGRAILSELAPSGKPAVMELSGNDAFIVCDDAPLDLAARAAVWGRVSNAGQSCVAPQRFYVAEEIYKMFLDQVKAQLEALRPDEATPLRTSAARDRCHHLVRSAVEHGARLLLGGDFDPDRPGFYYSATLLADCHEHSGVMNEDLFGPVIAVSPVRDDREAIERANADPLALGASVWTRDARRGAALADKLRVGLVSVNSVMLDAARPEVSFGGMRSSGFGKQRGVQGLEEMVVRKVVALHRPDGAHRHMFPYFPAATRLLIAMARLRLPGKLRSAWELASAACAWQRQNTGYMDGGGVKL